MFLRIITHAQFLQEYSCGKFRREVEPYFWDLVSTFVLPDITGREELGLREFFALTPIPHTYPEILSALNIRILSMWVLVRERLYEFLRVPEEYMEELLTRINDIYVEGQPLMGIVGQEILALLREEILKTAPIAHRLLVDIISGKEPAPIGLRLKYASEALARIGLGPITKSVSMSSDTLSRDDIERIKERAHAAIEASVPKVLEAEYETRMPEPQAPTKSSFGALLKYKGE